MKKLGSVHKENLYLFREVAKHVVDSYMGKKDAAETALAASLACMLGILQKDLRQGPCYHAMRDL